jgi:hypothetical protein
MKCFALSDVMQARKKVSEFRLGKKIAHFLRNGKAR